MSRFVTYTVLAFMAAYAAIVVIDFVRQPRIVNALVQAAGLALIFLLLHLTVNFPKPVTAFGGTSPLFMTAVMLICVILGTTADYVLHLGKSSFSWRAMIRPLVISPIVLLPLLGTVQGSGEVNHLQLVSFAFLAFQNGFFWKTVLDRAKPTTE